MSKVCSTCQGQGTTPEEFDSAFGTTEWVNVECYKCDGTGHIEIEVKFYMKGDPEGKLYTEEFITQREYDHWLKNFGESVEIFSLEN